MEIRQLKYFVSVARLAQITKAAVEQNISQPSLSAQIKLLEEEVEVKLFDRSQKKVILTEPGKVLYKHAVTILNQLEDCKKELVDIKQLNKGKILLGSLPTVIVTWLPNIISSFRKKYPNIEIEVRDLHTPELKKSLDQYEIELAIITYPLDNDKYNTYPFLKEELILITPLGHKFAKKTQIEMKELSEEPFILYKNDTQSRYTVIEACNEAGFVPKIAFENNRVEIVISFVSSGLGVAFVPKGSLNLSRNYKVHSIPVVNPKPVRTLCLATSKSRYISNAVNTFENYLLSNFKE